MPTRKIPCVLMRGGTSRGPYFLASDLPADEAGRADVLIQAMGSGHQLEVDGLGGGNALTSKVAIISPGSVQGADVDYLFAQVLVHEKRVDFSPNCGNMLAGVGPFAIEAGLVKAGAESTSLRIYNVNTRKIIEARVMTPGGRVKYDGGAAIDGVPGTAAPIHLAFLDAAGSKTGALLPTGSPVDVINGVRVSCVDAAMPVMLVLAADLGKTGGETAADYARDKPFMERLEALRIEAGARMGIADARDKVIPKPVLVSAPAAGGALRVRYFMPHDCHTSLSVTGGVAIATAVVTPGTLAAETAGPIATPADIRLEHPSGRLDIRVEHREGAPIAMVVRTARRIMEGFVIVDLPDVETGARAA